jgi:hypothetical protein
LMSKSATWRSMSLRLSYNTHVLVIDRLREWFLTSTALIVFEDIASTSSLARF